MRRSNSEPRMETMMEPMHPRRLEKKANIKGNRRWSEMWLGLSQKLHGYNCERRSAEATSVVRCHAGRLSHASGVISRERCRSWSKARVSDDVEVRFVFASLYVEMTRAFNEGTVKPRNGRTPENTTPTRFEDFASELADAVRQRQAVEVPR